MRENRPAERRNQRIIRNIGIAMLIDPSVRVDLFHTPTGTAFADLVINGHRETWPIRSVRFRAWLRRQYYEATGNAASADCVNSTLNLLEARAQFDGPERAVHVRVAEQDATSLLISPTSMCAPSKCERRRFRRAPALHGSG
jgi:hypothetical protein